jgi:hypothetical protein
MWLRPVHRDESFQGAARTDLAYGKVRFTTEADALQFRM